MLDHGLRWTLLAVAAAFAGYGGLAHTPIAAAQMVFFVALGLMVIAMVASFVEETQKP